MASRWENVRVGGREIASTSARPMTAARIRAWRSSDFYVYPSGPRLPLRRTDQLLCRSLQERLGADPGRVPEIPVGPGIQLNRPLIKGSLPQRCPTRKEAEGVEGV